MPSPESSNVPTSMPEPEGGNFLKAEHIQDGDTIKIIGNLRAGEAGGFSPFIISVEHKGEVYDFGLKPKSGNYSRLYSAFGPDPRRWKGKSFKVKRATHMNKEYVQLQ